MSASPSQIFGFFAKTLVLGLLTSAVNALEVGDAAPDFHLAATDGNHYTLSQFDGESAIVLAWFPRAFTQGCTLECKSLAEDGHLIEEYNAKYFMISVDPLETNLSFATETGATFPLLSDESKAVAAAYGVLNERGLANRHTFFIDKSGNILAIDTQVNAETAAVDIANKLGELGIERL